MAADWVAYLPERPVPARANLNAPHRKVTERGARSADPIARACGFTGI